MRSLINIGQLNYVRAFQMSFLSFFGKKKYLVLKHGSDTGISSVSTAPVHKE